MERWSSVMDRGEELFNSGYSCCESVVLAVSEYLGLQKDILLKVATPFGSGMSRNGSTCGALSGAFICIGSVLGRASNSDSRDDSYLPADRVFSKFKEEYGTSICYNITGVNLRDPEEVQNNKERLHKELCGPLVRQSIYWVLEELDK